MFGIASQHCLLALLAPQQPMADHALTKASSDMLKSHLSRVCWTTRVVRQRSAVKVQAAGSLRRHGGLLEGHHSERLHG